MELLESPWRTWAKSFFFLASSKTPPLKSCAPGQKAYASRAQLRAYKKGATSLPIGTSLQHFLVFLAYYHRRVSNHVSRTLADDSPVLGATHITRSTKKELHLSSPDDENTPCPYKRTRRFFVPLDLPLLPPSLQVAEQIKDVWSTHDPSSVLRLRRVWAVGGGR